MKQIFGIVLAAAAFAAAGWLTYTQAAPAPVVWTALGLLGVGVVVLVFALRYRTRSPAGTAEAGTGPAPPKRGSSHRVRFDGEKFTLKDLATGETATMRWQDVTAVYIVALEGSDEGELRYVVHQGERAIEVPLAADGNEAFLAAMQERLPGFDDAGLIEGMAMAHGIKQLWPSALLPDAVAR
ncbi:MAG TPA: hypothetical protein VIL43_00145 [Burkholderiales bacterium]